MANDVAAEPKVLIVDDDSDVRRMLSVLLRLEGYQVTEARDGMEALGSFHRDRPDLIVLDIAMPRLDGFEVLDRVRALSAKDDYIPVVILSAFSDQERIEEGYRRGAAIYMTKPAHIPDLLSLVARLCGKEILS